MSEFSSEAQQSNSIDSKSSRFTFGIRHLFLLTTAVCLLLMFRSLGLLLPVLMLIVCVAFFLGMIRSLLAASKISRLKLFRALVYFTLVNYAYAISVPLVALAISSLNVVNHTTVGLLGFICLMALSAHFFTIATFSAILYVKAVVPNRSVLLAGLNLAPFVMAFTFFYYS
jgi:hypothetical protein